MRTKTNSSAHKLDEPAAIAPSPVGRFSALVVLPGGFENHWLPEFGEAVVGSASDADIRIQSNSVAPYHAVVRIGAELQVEVLDANAEIWLQGTAKKRGQLMALAPGEPIKMGEALLVIQRPVPNALRRIWSHGYFTARIEEECDRAERTRTRFSLVRIRCDPTASALAIEEILANTLRIVDIVGNYLPGEYEVLLPETAGPGTQTVIERIAARLADSKIEAQIGVASFPVDGRSGDVLLEKASGKKQRSSPSGIVDGSVMGKLHEMVNRIAQSEINVLILGETGVGKERLAEMVHQLSPRRDHPMLRLNCAALTETLLESELFGHERGAFTGAVQAKQGLLETANGGTVFLDEIGELPPSTQAKLLRVIEERQVLRVGAIKVRNIDVRFISATNRDLEVEASRNTFRADLYFRLNGVSINIPPLRERVSEIAGLAKAFVTEAAEKMKRSHVPTIAPVAMSLLEKYSWPGNIRELRNVVERALVLCGQDAIDLDDIPVENLTTRFAPRTVSRPSRAIPEAAEPQLPKLVALSSTTAFPVAASADESPIPKQPLRLDVQRQVATYEKERIIEALNACAGNQTAAAKKLGISRRALVTRLDTYHIPRPRKR